MVPQTSKPMQGSKFSIPGSLVDAQHRAKSMLGRAWQHIGKGYFDHEISQPQVCAVISDWKMSRAMPPDLLPRAAFTCENQAWGLVVWHLCQLAGPAKWALRPSLWR